MNEQLASILHYFLQHTAQPLIIMGVYILQIVAARSKA
jgi:hypothetical protein